MKKIIMPSEKKIYDLKGGWYSKETKDGARALYHDSVFDISKGFDQAALLTRARNPRTPSGGATVYSDGWTKVRAGRKVGPNEMTGSLRHIFWNFASLPAGAIADVLVCGLLWKGDRVLGGREVHSALSSAGGVATGSYGTYAVLADGISLGAVDDADRFLAATDFDAAGANLLATTIALFFGYEATADLFVCCVNSVEAFATAGVVSGYLQVAKT